MIRVALRAPFDQQSGYGRDGLDLALALADGGFDVVPFPTTIMPGLPPQFLALLGKDPTPRPDVVLAFMPPYDMRPSRFARGIRSIGYTMWERLPMLPDEIDGHGWDAEVVKDPRTPLAHLDRLVVTCEMNVQALGPLWWGGHDGPARSEPVPVIPCGVDGERWPEAERDRNRPMRFLMVGALGPRKNPFAVLEAWRDVKREHPDFDATLTLHSTAPGLHPHAADVYGPDVTIHTRTVSTDDLVALYHDHDVMLCPSRGEGNNKPPQEFMATGGFVIASDWSGHRNWLHPDANWAIPGQVVDSPLHPGTRDFEVDPQALRDLIWKAFTERERVRRMGEFSARFIRSSASWERTVDALRPLLQGDDR